MKKSRNPDYHFQTYRSICAGAFFLFLFFSGFIEINAQNLYLKQKNGTLTKEEWKKFKSLMDEEYEKDTNKIEFKSFDDIKNLRNKRITPIENKLK